MFRAILCTMTGLLMVGSALAEPNEKCSKSEDLPRATVGCTQVLRELPNNARAYTLRGFAHLEMDNRNLALADFNKAIEIDPNYADAYAGRGEVRPQGEEDQAMDDFNKAIELDPRNARAYYFRSGFWLPSLPDYVERQLSDLTKAIDFAPAFMMAYVLRGHLYVAEGRRDLAKGDYARAIEINANAAILIRAFYPELVDEIEADRRAAPR